MEMRSIEFLNETVEMRSGSKATERFMHHGQSWKDLNAECGGPARGESILLMIGQIHIKTCSPRFVVGHEQSSSQEYIKGMCKCTVLSLELYQEGQGRTLFSSTSPSSIHVDHYNFPHYPFYQYVATNVFITIIFIKKKCTHEGTPNACPFGFTW